MNGTVAIIGTGLIGGSVGLALRARTSATNVIGYDADPAVAARARARGGIDIAVGDLSDVATAGVVVVATPVDAVRPTLEQLKDIVDPTCIVTDVSSVKAGIVAAGEDRFGGNFVGGHPMAGSETHGIEAAAADLLDDSWWILTPTDRTSERAYRVVSELVGSVGARVVAVEPKAHDELLARLSHVPQLVASAVVAAAATDSAEPSLLQLAGNGFRDVTRIAASDPQLWTGIVAANSQGVLEALSALRAQLEDVEGLIACGSWDELSEWFDHARAARLALFAKAHVPADVVGLEMIVPDRPGVLAEVTTAAGRRGANIEDLRIIHSTEGGRGRLEVLIAGAAAGEALRADLENLGYHVRVVTTEL